MSTKYYPFGGQTYNLGTSIGSTDSSILLSSFLEPVTNVPYTMVLLNTDIAYGTIAPKTTSSEFISFTGITQNADGSALLTGVVRGLAKKYPFTADAAYKLPHSGQTQFIISDAPQVFQQYISLNNDETIGGVKTFSSNVTIPLTPVASTDAASKGYADALVIAGAPNASTTVKGIGQVSVAPVSPTTPIFVGDNDPRVPTQGENDALVGNNTDIAVGTGNKFVTQTGLQHGAEFYAADTGAADVMVVTLSPIPTSYTTGMVIKVKAGHANATTTPTINVNALGAKTITKNGTSALVANDIVTNEVITLMYDGTQFQLQTPPALTPPLATTYASGTASKTLTDASTTQNIPHGLGKIPRYLRLTGRLVAQNAFLVFSEYGGNATSGAGISVNSVNNASNQVALLTSFRIGTDYVGTATYQDAAVTADATNIILTWTKTGSPTGIAGILWEAQA